MSSHYWDERRFRKQEFMSRFARANRVLYVEPSFSSARSPQPHLREIATNRYLLSRRERRSDRLHLLKPPRAIPKWTDARVERLNYRWYGSIVRRAARRLGFSDEIAWVYRPSYHHALRFVPHRHLVFDLVDDLSAYGGEHSTQVERSIRGLVEASDLLVVTAQTLYERHRSAAAEIVRVPNGFDRELFSPDLAGAQPPAPLRDLPRPLLGFIGTLFKFLDFDLLERVARAHHDKSLVLVGPVEADVAEDVARLRRLPNVTHVGARPQREIPSYVAAFDVCLNPFRGGRVADSVSPLKVYEYLAMGRPVVSVPMRALEMEEVAGSVTFARDPAHFCRQVDACLEPAVQDGAGAREASVAGYSWDSLFGRLDSACEAALSS